MLSRSNARAFPRRAGAAPSWAERAPAGAPPVLVVGAGPYLSHVTGSAVSVRKNMLGW